MGESVTKAELREYKRDWMRRKRDRQRREWAHIVAKYLPLLRLVRSVSND